MWSDPRLRAAVLGAVALTLLAAPAAAQCRPTSERTGEVGGWIIAREPLGRLAEIGSLAVTPGESYAAQYMEGIFDPGMTTDVHYHPGPEAMCGAGEAATMPAGHLHTLTATGTAQRRSLALVVHESDRPWRLPSSDWSPRGLCEA